jgi:hypothetical protein
MKRAGSVLGRPTNAEESAASAHCRGPAREKKIGRRPRGPPTGKLFFFFLFVCFTKPFSNRISKPNQIK